MRRQRTKQTCTIPNLCLKQKALPSADQHRGQSGAAQAAGLRQQAQDAGDLPKSEKETAQLETLTEEEQSWKWHLIQMTREMTMTTQL